MNKFKSSITLLLILSIALLITACSSSDDGVKSNPINDSETTANLIIKVVDASDTAKALDGAYVRIAGVSELKTGSNGTVTFNLTANDTYTISVIPTSNDYLANKGIEINLADKEKEKTIKMAKSLVEPLTILAETTEVGNGLADMELDEDSKKVLQGNEVSVDKAEKNMVDLIAESDIEGVFDETIEEVIGETYSFKISGNNVSTNTDTSQRPTVTMKLDLSNLVDDISSIDSSKYGLLAVIIDGEDNVEVTKEWNIAIDSSKGKISGKIPLRNEQGNLVEEIDLSIIVKSKDSGTGDNKETTVEDAKQLVTDLKAHGVNLKEVGEVQAHKIETNLKQDVVPYLVAMGYRLEKVEEVLEVWNDLFGIEVDTEEGFTGYGPGKYTINLAGQEAYHNYIDSAKNNWWKYEEVVLAARFSDYNDYHQQWEQYQQEYPNEYDGYKYYYFAKYNSEYKSYYEAEDLIDGYVENTIRAEAAEATDYIVVKDLVKNAKELEQWEWNITFTDSAEEVTIRINNVKDIISSEELHSEEYKEYEKTIVDLTKADFSYLHTSADNSAINWSLDFTVEGAETDTIKHDIDDTSIIPTEGSINLKGSMIDNLAFTDEDGIFVDLYEEGIYDSDDELPVDVPAIGKVSIDAMVNMDLTNSNSKSISYEGSFNSEEFNYQGNAEVNFVKFPSSLQAIADEVEYPVVSSFNSSGEFTTQVFKISGSTQAEFVFEETEGDEDDILFPNTINFAGSYQDLSVDDGFTLNGSLDIDLNVEDKDIDLQALNEGSETRDNYLGGTVTLKGELKNMKYGDVNLDVEIIRDGYKHLTTDFRYDYAGDKFIEGEVIVGADSDYKLTAYNQANLKLIMTEYEGAEQEKIGEIRSYYGTKIYGEIMAADDPFVQFSDKDTITLLPDKE